MKNFVPSNTAIPASTIHPSPKGMPVTEFAPRRQFSPILIGFPLVPLRTPKMLAPPPISLPFPTTALELILPSTITGPKVPALKLM